LSSHSTERPPTRWIHERFRLRLLKFTPLVGFSDGQSRTRLTLLENENNTTAKPTTAGFWFVGPTDTHRKECASLAGLVYPPFHPPGPLPSLQLSGRPLADAHQTAVVVEITRLSLLRRKGVQKTARAGQDLGALRTVVAVPQGACLKRVLDQAAGGPRQHLRPPSKNTERKKARVPKNCKVVPQDLGFRRAGE